MKSAYDGLHTSRLDQLDPDLFECAKGRRGLWRGRFVPQIERFRATFILGLKDGLHHNPG